MADIASSNTKNLWPVLITIVRFQTLISSLFCISPVVAEGAFFAPHALCWATETCVAFIFQLNLDRVQVDMMGGRACPTLAIPNIILAEVEI